MRLSRRALLAAAAVGTAAGVAAGCDSRSPGSRPVRVATGGVGGVYARIGAALTRTLADDYPRLRPEVLVTSASAANLKLIDAGQAEVGFTQADVLTGTGLPLPTALARLYDDYLHLVVRADDPARAVTDLRGRSVSTGAAGSGTEVTVTRVLTAAGMRLPGDLVNVPLGVGESATALASGRIAAFFFSGGLPVEAISALAAREPIRLLPLGGYLPALRNEFGLVYASRTIPRSTYHIAPAETIGVPNLLVAAATLDEDIAYAVTRTVVGRSDVLAGAHPAAERVNHTAAILTDPLPLHPGAARYFRDQKR